MFQVRLLHEYSLTETVTFFWHRCWLVCSILEDFVAGFYSPLVVLLLFLNRLMLCDWLGLLLGLFDNGFFNFLLCHYFLLIALTCGLFLVLILSFSHHFFKFFLLAHLSHVQFFELSFFSLFTLLEQLLDFGVTCAFIVLLRFLVLMRLVILSFLSMTGIFGLWEHFNVSPELVHLVFCDFLHFHLQFQLIYFHFKLETEFSETSLHRISAFLQLTVTLVWLGQSLLQVKYDEVRPNYVVIHNHSVLLRFQFGSKFLDSFVLLSYQVVFAWVLELTFPECIQESLIDILLPVLVDDR